MIFYSEQTALGLLLACVPLWLSLYWAFIDPRARRAIWLLVFAGLLIRLLMISLDPYLYEWDERFHALVAKNMMEHPFKPMLYVDPVRNFDLHDWTGNHIWLHKQPLFMWQSALSMKLFGVNEIAMRLPAAIAGALSIFMIYEIGKFWTKNFTVAYLSAFLFALSFFQLELTSGWFGNSQNDVIFSFYVTASIWAFVRYLRSPRNHGWAALVGVFVGGAVLTKWLTGLLILGGWALFITLGSDWKRRNPWSHLGLATFVSLLVFVPWQLFISNAYPEVSAIEYAHNIDHVFKVLDRHGGDIWFYPARFGLNYGFHLFWIFLPATALVLRNKEIDRRLSIAFLSMIGALYMFLTLIVTTKRAAYAYPVHSLVWILIAYGVFLFLEKVTTRLSVPTRKWLWIFAVVIMGSYVLRPGSIVRHRSGENEMRNIRIHNTQLFKTVEGVEGKIVFNCSTHEGIDLMFYRNTTAYHGSPSAKELDELIRSGYKIAAFESHGDYVLPDYVLDNKAVEIIDEELK
jgi:4-amino-4-deoxy-L-arabinose transferase